MNEIRLITICLNINYSSWSSWTSDPSWECEQFCKLRACLTSDVDFLIWTINGAFCHNQVFVWTFCLLSVLPQQVPYFECLDKTCVYLFWRICEPDNGGGGGGVDFCLRLGSVWNRILLKMLHGSNSCLDSWRREFKRLQRGGIVVIISTST